MRNLLASACVALAASTAGTFASPLKVSAGSELKWIVPDYKHKLEQGVAQKVFFYFDDPEVQATVQPADFYPTTAAEGDDDDAEVMPPRFRVAVRRPWFWRNKPLSPQDPSSMRAMPLLDGKFVVDKIDFSVTRAAALMANVDSNELESGRRGTDWALDHVYDHFEGEQQQQELQTPRPATVFQMRVRVPDSIFSHLSQFGGETLQFVVSERPVKYGSAFGGLFRPYHRLSVSPPIPTVRRGLLAQNVDAAFDSAAKGLHGARQFVQTCVQCVGDVAEVCRKVANAYEQCCNDEPQCPRPRTIPADVGQSPSQRAAEAPAAPAPQASSGRPTETMKVPVPVPAQRGPVVSMPRPFSPIAGMKQPLGDAESEDYDDDFEPDDEDVEIEEDAGRRMATSWKEEAPVVPQPVTQVEQPRVVIPVGIQRNVQAPIAPVSQQQINRVAAQPQFTAKEWHQFQLFLKWKAAMEQQQRQYDARPTYRVPV